MLAACENALVLSNEQVDSDIYRLCVKWDAEGGARAPHAGQFFTVRAWGADETPFLSRPISVHAWDADSETLTFLYQVKGAGTHKIAALVAGASAQITGPMGNGFDSETLARTHKKIAVVGGGIGTAPMFQLTRELCAKGAAPDCFFGFHSAPYNLGVYDALGVSVKISTDDGSAGHKGFVTQLYDPTDYDIVLVCGPDVMMKNAAKACVAAGTACLCSLEAKMACGIGACLGCTCKTTANEARSICKHGPVFNAKEVYAW